MSLKQLYDQKMVKLAEQKSLSDTMNTLLVQHMNPSQREVKRNLIAAIATAKQPGYFQYYEKPDKVKQAESQKELNSMARKIAKSAHELEQLNNEIASATAAAKGRTPPDDQQLSTINEWFAKNGGRGNSEAGVSSLSSWFNTYGKPQMSGEFQKDMLSKFEENKKIYGGTAHHRSFKSKAVTLKLGSLTR
jgi:hypothetical protein